MRQTKPPPLDVAPPFCGGWYKYVRALALREIKCATQLTFWDNDDLVVEMSDLCISCWIAIIRSDAFNFEMAFQTPVSENNSGHILSKKLFAVFVYFIWKDQ